MKFRTMDIHKLLSDGERVTFECKKATKGVPSSLWETYSAFANTYGGIILLGVVEHMDEHDRTKRFEIFGVEDADKIRKDLWNTLNSREKVNINLLYDDDIQTIDVDGKKIISTIFHVLIILFALFILTIICQEAHSNVTMKATIIARSKN